MEKEIKLKNNGFFYLFVHLIFLFSPFLLISIRDGWVIAGTLFLSFYALIGLIGFFIVQPNQTKVLVFFGKYKGTVKQNGFFWLNPFYTKKKVSLRVRNLETDIIKVNDEQGNPILISAVVVWKVIDTYKAVFDIEAKEEVDSKSGMKKVKAEESYQNFVKIQAEAALRRIAHSYPYDNLEEGQEDGISLRSGVDEINKSLASEIKERLKIVGIEVMEARISNLSYAPEIAAIMLQRQQAQAIISARKKIVKGSVGMVEMALQELSEKEIVKLSPEKKASMVSNLMVVLCSDQGTSPVVNTGIDHS
ncbi:SPFH domain-containing protein [Xanthovirga aplysinae]|uniref:SPFH domain-containing protein n=1 Tax=Xanthovirga aplysinae TaxID=2529853 RepID=UPI0012BC2171|nr:SPFH domain-containing protein [Xanthovirga aplysinae]MTI32292.1 SPFH domain-containing protein [Xanthovirga aplysinae]